MLFTHELKALLIRIREAKPSIKLYLYTALPYPYKEFNQILDLLDGCSITLHGWDDVRLFSAMGYGQNEYVNKSMRLNVFPKVIVECHKSWDVRPKVWLKECPLPEDAFVRLIK